MKNLTKEDILKGKEKRETLYVDAYGSNVVIRPLTDGELSEVFSILGSIPMNDDGSPDTSRIEIVKNFDALRYVTSLGLIEPQLTREDVAGMKFGVPEFIGTRILEASGIVPEAELKKKE